MIRRALLPLALVAATLAAAAGQAAAKAPYVKHVFIVVLENESADTTFGKDSPAPYLANTLRKKGAFVPNYYATGHLSNDNYLAMVSGQAPNPQTQADCQFYNDFTPGTPTSGGQYIGQGCVYPPGVETVANQLKHSGYTWKAYIEDMNSVAPNGQQPNYSFIASDLCHDGHDSPCATRAPGDRIGAIMMSRCIEPGTRTEKPYDHYSMLHSIESNLGYAGQAGLSPFGRDLFTDPSCGR